MRITVSESALTMVRRVRAEGRDNLIMVLGSGCCDSTAPFLYDNYLPEPDSVRVGEVDGIEVLAPGWLAKLYADGEGDEMIVDVDEGVVNDSFSLESEFDARFTLRVPGRPEQR